MRTTVSWVPLIQITSLPQPPGVDCGAVLVAVNEAVGELLGRPADVAWSTWTMLAPGSYAVGAAPADVQPTTTHPPVVHVYAERPAEVMEQIADRVAETLDTELGLPPGSAFVTTARVNGH
jgi:hypothetical protein